jgi:hypothetical protein
MDVDGGKIWQHLPGFAKSQALANVWNDPRARADTDRNTGADGANLLQDAGDIVRREALLPVGTANVHVKGSRSCWHHAVTF